MRVQLRILAVSTLTTLVLVSTSGHAQTNNEEVSTTCSEAARLIADNDINGAFEEAQWCFESVHQLKQQQTIAIFPDSIDGFVGDQIEDNSAMGMVIIERSYTRGEQQLSVQLGVGAMVSAAAQMASAMTMVPGITRKRVGSFTVVQMPNSEGEFMVALENDASLIITTDSVDADGVMDFLRQFPVEQLENSIG